jgi:protein ImuB
MALQHLLEALCKRLYGEGRGIRMAIFSWYRVDGQSGNITVGTNHPSQRTEHLFKLFTLKLDTVAPGLGIELFTLDATKTEPASDKQSNLWAGKPAAGSEEIAELLDRLTMRIGSGNIHRYLPDEHYWPERTITGTGDMKKTTAKAWQPGQLRPIQILEPPEPIVAMSMLPDYPPKQFIYKGRRHVVVNADGPDRIEREWWLDQGEHRDYYVAEDEDGCRYWLFRSGHYDPNGPQQWFIHGFFE